MWFRPLTGLTKIVSAIVTAEVKQLVKVPEDDRPADKDNLKKFESNLIRYKNFSDGFLVSL